MRNEQTMRSSCETCQYSSVYLDSAAVIVVVNIINTEVLD